MTKPQDSGVFRVGRRETDKHDPEYCKNIFITWQTGMITIIGIILVAGSLGWVASGIVSDNTASHVALSIRVTAIEQQTAKLDTIIVLLKRKE